MAKVNLRIKYEDGIEVGSTIFWFHHHHHLLTFSVSSDKTLRLTVFVWMNEDRFSMANNNLKLAITLYLIKTLKLFIKKFV